MNSCLFCGDETKNKKYCSVPCQHDGYKKQKVQRIFVKCNFCNCIIEKIPSKIRNKNYCSKKCSSLDKKNTMLGELNHRYGKQNSLSLKEKKSIFMKEKWKDEEYRKKRALGFEKAMENRKYWFGNSPEDISKKKETFIKKYGKHPFTDEEYRKKCDEKCIELYGLRSVEIAKKSITEEVIERRKQKLIETILKISYEDYEKALSKKEKYYKIVKKITELQNLSSLENYEKRGRVEIEGSYHLDHIIPISYGLINNIDPNIIGHISNLRFIPAVENIKKGCKYEQKN